MPPKATKSKGKRPAAGEEGNSEYERLAEVDNREAAGLFSWLGR